MKKLCSRKSKRLCIATVLANISICKKFYLLKLKFTGQSAKTFAKTVPGQFAEFRIDTFASPDVASIPKQLFDNSLRNIILRRPFSFANVSIKPDSVQLDIVYCVLGPATLRMTTIKEGDQISIIGPLGNGFSIQPQKRVALLVAGGMGAPPIRHLAEYIKENHSAIEVISFTGAKTATDLLFKSGSDINSFITTDDGSEGSAGFVTDSLLQWFDDKKRGVDDKTVIYACGPEPMLAKVAEIAESRRIDCQVSLERRMACGIGVCQSCAVLCKAGDEKVYKLCCKDGPVFDSREIVW